MSDEELACALGIINDPRWPKAIARMTPEKRAAYENLIDVGNRLVTDPQISHSAAGGEGDGIDEQE